MVHLLGDRTTTRRARRSVGGHEHAPCQEELEAGYWRAYRDFYRWGSILRGASTKGAWGERLRHLAYARGWKKLEPLWDLVIRARRVTTLLPVLEGVLSGFGRHATVTAGSASDRAIESAGSSSTG